MSRKSSGSLIAKNGFINEQHICSKFNNWRNDAEAQAWLRSMIRPHGFELSQIESVTAVDIPANVSKATLKKRGIILRGGTDELSAIEFDELVKQNKKADAQVHVLITIGKIHLYENISLKRAEANFNQIDKRRVGTYQRMWGFDSYVERWLSLMTGAISPEIEPLCSEISRQRGYVLLKEMPHESYEAIRSFFDKNKVLVVADTIKGRGCLSASWVLVTEHNLKLDSTSYALCEINKTLNFLASGPVAMTPRGSVLSVGRITMQRYGGSPHPENLQFKFRPKELFSEELL